MRYRAGPRAALTLVLAASVALMCAGSGAAGAQRPAGTRSGGRDSATGSSGAGGSGSGLTTTYRWVDAQGVIHFSDTPRPGAQKLEIPPAQSFGTLPPAPVEVPEPMTDAADVQHSAYQACTITRPAPQQSLYTPESVAVQVELIPSLRPSDQLTVRLDGRPLAPSSGDGLTFGAPAPNRGTHTVTAIVTSSTGQVVCMAAPVTFYVQRPSLLSPSSPTFGHSAPHAPSVPHAPGVPPPPSAPPAPGIGPAR